MIDEIDALLKKEQLDEDHKLLFVVYDFVICVVGDLLVIVFYVHVEGLVIRETYS